MSGAGSDSAPFAPNASGARQHAPATLRNREPLARALAQILPQSGLVLEIASGTGEHAVFFAGQFPDLQWQPTDVSDAAMASIAAWRREARPSNLLAPLRLDLADPDWPVDRADAIFCANMTHIAPWEATRGLLAGAGRVLTPGAILAIYGPFIEPGVATAASNLAFDADLKARDERWGLRDTRDLDRLAARNELVAERRIAMPANNILLVYRRT